MLQCMNKRYALFLEAPFLDFLLMLQNTFIDLTSVLEQTKTPSPITFTTEAEPVEVTTITK